MAWLAFFRSNISRLNSSVLSAEFGKWFSALFFAPSFGIKETLDYNCILT
jgi:hypothetical protein